MARTGLSRKTDDSMILPPEKRWTVVSRETGMRVYLSSERGIGKEEAESLSARLLVESLVVPEGALDQWGRLDESLLEDALRVAAEAE